MKNKQIALSAVIAGCLLFSSLSFASSERVEFEKGPLTQYSGGPEQVTTNVLLRQILAEVIKANSQKEDKRCSDGEKNYSPGYIISVDKKTLRCDIGNGYPEWVEGDKS